MAICKYDNQRRADLCGQNAEYITRLSKVAEIHFHNLPELQDGIALDDLQGRRDAAMSYAETRELESNKKKRIKNSKPKIDPRTGKEKPTRQDRNHHTLIFSWDRTETPERAIQMTREFLTEKLPNARAIYSVHIDKAGQTHTHVFIDTKLVSGRKLQIAPKTFYNFDSAWAKKFDGEYGTAYAPIFRERSEETRAWKAERAAAKARGEEFTKPKPERYGDVIKRNLKEIMRARDNHNRGVVTHEQTRTRTGERTVTTGRAGIERADRAIDSGKQRVAAATRNLNDTVREAKEYLEREHIREHDGRAR
jgi:hypothetical protein